MHTVTGNESANSQVANSSAETGEALRDFYNALGQMFDLNDDTYFASCKRYIYSCFVYQFRKFASIPRKKIEELIEDAEIRSCITYGARGFSSLKD